MSRADVLRRAAALMRERADSAIESWTYPYPEPFDLPWWDAESLELPPACHTREDAEHIAHLTPDVAIAVAAWLDSVRTSHEIVGGKVVRYCSDTREQDAALAVARRYLVGP